MGCGSSLSKHKDTSTEVPRQGSFCLSRDGRIIEDESFESWHTYHRHRQECDSKVGFIFGSIPVVLLNAVHSWHRWDARDARDAWTQLQPWRNQKGYDRDYQEISSPMYSYIALIILIAITTIGGCSRIDRRMFRLPATPVLLTDWEASWALRTMTQKNNRARFFTHTHAMHVNSRFHIFY